MSVGSIFVVEAKRKRPAQRQVQERIDANSCVCCGKSVVGEDGKIRRWRRGLCTTCEGRWETAKSGLNDQQRAQLEADMIADGLLLEEGEITRLREGTNPFALKAAEIAGA